MNTSLPRAPWWSTVGEMTFSCMSFEEFDSSHTSCSAGIGRTGTFITIDHVLEQIERENVVDIPGVIQSIRQQRMKMVQTVVCKVFAVALNEL